MTHLMMNENRSFYDLLEITPDASQQEIRTAYLRVKSAYKKDSVALYTLISESETEDLLRKIEEAYQMLSNPERRKEYDRNHGVLKLDDSPFPRAESGSGSAHANVISIDRVPPMEDLGGDSDILMAPSTDFSQVGARSASSTVGSSLFEPSENPSPFIPSAQPERPGSLPASMVHKPSGASASPPGFLKHPQDPWADQAIAQEIHDEMEWRGAFLRKVREARGVPIEELSDFTKISKTYLLAIEDENYARLPATVYLRGFVTQLAKYLKLPPDKVSAAYLARFAQALLDREKSKSR